MPSRCHNCKISLSIDFFHIQLHFLDRLNFTVVIEVMKKKFGKEKSAGLGRVFCSLSSASMLTTSDMSTWIPILRTDDSIEASTIYSVLAVVVLIVVWIISFMLIWFIEERSGTITNRQEDEK